MGNQKNKHRSSSQPAINTESVEFKFNKKHSALYKKDDWPTLSILGEFFNYSFTKYRTRTIADYINLILVKDFASLYAPRKEKVCVTMRLSEIKKMQYDAATNFVWVVGRFKAVYIDPRTGDATIKEYYDEDYCFEFQYVFDDHAKFDEMIQKYKSQNEFTSIPEPVSF
jgi:hypothetical protein